MNMRKHLALVSALLAVGVSPLAAGQGVLSNAPGPLPESTMQSLSSEMAPWHAGDGSIYDASRGRGTTGAAASEGTPAQPSGGTAPAPMMRRPPIGSPQQPDYSAPPTPAHQ